VDRTWSVFGTTRYIHQTTTVQTGFRELACGLMCPWPIATPPNVAQAGRCDIKATGGETDCFTSTSGPLKRTCPALPQRQRSTLYLLRYYESSIFRTSLSIVRFPLGRHLPAGVTSGQQVERARGFRAMQFKFVVSSNERAVGIWQSFGFAIVGRLPLAFDHPAQVDALVMFRAL
jgi:hypothetical protein